jgi:hypothetical protein
MLWHKAALGLDDEELEFIEDCSLLAQGES